MSTFKVVQAADGDGTGVYDIFGMPLTVKVAGSSCGGRLSLMHSTTPPLAGPPLHRHLTDSETFYVLDGHFVFELDGERVELGAGDTLFIPPGVVHRYQCVGDVPGNVLCLVEPAGLDEFFGELHALLKRPGPPDMGEIAALHARFGMELLGPPMSAEQD